MKFSGCKILRLVTLLFIWVAAYQPVEASESIALCNARAVAEMQQGHGFNSSSQFDKPLDLSDDLNRSANNDNVGQYSYRVIAQYPHNRRAFTQGLVVFNGKLYESTGKYGRSGIHRVDIETGRYLATVELAPTYFGEGLSVVGGKLVQLTWKSGRAFVYEVDDLKPVRELVIGGERWGSATLDDRLLLSDGSPNLEVMDIGNRETGRLIQVREGRLPVRGINEMEIVNGMVFANVWPTACIVEIDPADGQVKNWLDLSRLIPESLGAGNGSVLNGIAYLGDTGHFLVTGKYWPFLYRIEIYRAE